MALFDIHMTLEERKVLATEAQEILAEHEGLLRRRSNGLQETPATFNELHVLGQERVNIIGDLRCTLCVPLDSVLPTDVERTSESISLGTGYFLE